MKTAKNRKKAGDIPLLVCVALMACFGCLMIYSASAYTAQVQYGDKFYFVKKQIVGFVLGLAAMIAVSFLPYEKLKKIGLPALLVSLVLLVLV